MSKTSRRLGTTVACLILLAVGPASVWAEALDCCPAEHREVTLQASDGCFAPVCCMMSAPVPARQSGQKQPPGAAAVQASAEIELVAANISTIVDPLAGASSPAHSQTSPVLLR